MNSSFTVPESLVKAEQGLNESMSVLSKSVDEVRKIAAVSSLFSQAADKNKETVNAFRESAKQFDVMACSLLKSASSIQQEISESQKNAARQYDATASALLESTSRLQQEIVKTQKDINVAHDKLRQFVITVIVVQSVMVIIATVIGFYLLK